MPSRSALGEARRIGVEDVPAREYHHKEVLEIRLPEIDAATRRTIVAVLNELMVSVFPNAHDYLTALTVDEGDNGGDLLDDLVVEGRADSIFIVENSLVDLGLIVAVERNWRRLLEIVADYLMWRETEVVPEPEPSSADAEPEFPPVHRLRPRRPRAVRALFAIGRALLAIIALFFGRRQPAGPDASPESVAAESSEASPAEAPADSDAAEPDSTEEAKS